jgi:hypothetical protein
MLLCNNVNLQELNDNNLQIKLINLMKLCVRHLTIIIDCSIIDKALLLLYDSVINSFKNVLERNLFIFSIQLYFT